MGFTTYATLRQARLLSRSISLQNGTILLNSRILAPRLSYSTKPRQPIQIRKPPSFDKVRFTPTDVPPLAFWQDVCSSPLFSDLDPEECQATAHKYVDLAIGNGPDWQKSLTKPPHSLSPTTLHYVAALIVMGPPGPPFHIATHIQHTLTTLNYAPSVLSLAMMALKTRKLGRPQFQAAEAKAAALARRKDDPNACTLQGLIILAGAAQRTADGTATATATSTEEADRQALEWFRTASSLGGEEPGAWEWQASCALEMGKAYERLKQPERARAIFEYCAKVLDRDEGCWLYANSLEPLHPERYVWMRKAAISGNKEAAREMAIYEELAAEAHKEGSWEQKASRVFQAEWEAIADDRAVR